MNTKEELGTYRTNGSEYYVYRIKTDLTSKKEKGNEEKEKQPETPSD